MASHRGSPWVYSLFYLWWSPLSLLRSRPVFLWMGEILKWQKSLRHILSNFWQCYCQLLGGPIGAAEERIKIRTESNSMYSVPQKQKCTWGQVKVCWMGLCGMGTGISSFIHLPCLFLYSAAILEVPLFKNEGSVPDLVMCGILVLNIYNWKNSKSKSVDLWISNSQISVKQHLVPALPWGCSTVRTQDGTPAGFKDPRQFYYVLKLQWNFLTTTFRERPFSSWLNI